MRLQEDDDHVLVSTDAYSLTVERHRPRAALTDGRGVPWTTLSLLASVNRVGAADETLPGTTVTTRQTGCGPQLIMEQPSSSWAGRRIVLDCLEDRLELAIEVRGEGVIEDVQLAGGRAVLPSGACGTFRSSIEAPSLFVPAPSEPIAVVRPSTSAATLTVVGDAEPGRLNGIFSPGPLALALGRRPPVGPTQVPEGEWLALWLRGSVAEANFTGLHYEPVDGGWLLRLPYDGHAVVQGSWRSPTLVISPVDDAWGAVTGLRDDLMDHQLITDEPPQQADWWHRPLFCGWGAQVALAEAGTAAGSLARQDHYDRWMETLDAAGIRPGTIVLDDKWQAEYGLGRPDPEKWPDLTGWIRDRHANDQRVLLWWKAWDPEGIPADECISDPTGRPVAVDPGNPAYRERLTREITHLLDPAEIGADGFKIDFTQRSPSGSSLSDSGPWGIALLHRLLQTIAEAARAVRPDALLITHAVHPWFADVTSMVRLNDVLERDVEGHPVPVEDQLLFRAAVAKAALPGHPIDTDQWPMPDAESWRRYVRSQPTVGVPALYYVDRINECEPLSRQDLDLVRASWREHSWGKHS